MSPPPTRRLLSWILILGLQLVLVLPFIGQPIHLDDPIYIDIGHNALKTPWQAMDFPYCLEGVCVPDMASQSHPPFMGYWIGLWIRLLGDGARLNIKLHLAFLIFPLLFAAGMFRLAQRFSALPELTTALAIASPTAIVMSHNLMPDYPNLACWTIGIALYVSGVDESKPWRVWSSALFLTLAAFNCYPSLIVVAICWIYAVVKKSRMRAALWAPVTPVVWMAGWITYSSLYFGRFGIRNTAQYYLQTKGSLGSAGMTDKLLAFPIMLASTLIVALPLIRAAFSWLRGGAAIIWAVVSIALALHYAATYALPERLLVVLFLTIGGWTILGLALCIAKSCTNVSDPQFRQDSIFLSAWVALMLPVVLFVYAYAAARYLLPLLPPIVLLTFSKVAWQPQTNWKRLAIAGLSIQLALGLAISLGDYDLAQTHRDIAQQLGESFKGWEKHVRFGGEWGFRYYMLEQGFGLFVLTSDDMAGGDFVVTPYEAVPTDLPQDVSSMLIPVSQKTWQSSIPIRTMNRESHAGFYSSGWGLLPFAFSTAPVEEITVRQVSYLVEKLPEISGLNAIPVPAAAGGADLVVSGPGRLAIPYNGPFPARIQFSCGGDCPMNVSYERQGTLATSLTVTRGKEKQFELRDPHPGTIVLDLAAPVTLHNWLVMPQGGLP